MALTRKEHTRKVTASGKDYNLARFEYIHLDVQNKLGQIKNNFTNKANVYLCGKVLKFTDQEFERQFNLNK